MLINRGLLAKKTALILIHSSSKISLFMQVLLYDYRWNSDTQVEFQASAGERFGRKQLGMGDALSVRVTAPVRCAGSMRDNVWQPCGQNIEGRKKCDVCRNREGNFVFTSFDGFNTDMYTSEDLARLQGEHLVYLALFDHGVTKVGVSKKERNVLRQVEQGSHQTLYIAEAPDGIKARQIETCFRQSGMADKVQASTKKNFICPEVTPEAGEKELRDILAAHQNALENHPELQIYLLENPKFVDWTQTFGVDAVNQSAKPLHSVKLEVDESVSGTILALKGPFIMLETEDEIVSLCAKDLQGLTLDFTPQPLGLKLNAALQNALF